MLTMTALVPTNDRIPIMYITTNSKTIITPNNTPYSSPDLPGTFSIELYLLIHKYNNSRYIGLQKTVLRFNKKKKTKICLLKIIVNLPQNNSVKQKSYKRFTPFLSKLQNKL
jgi:hypothetical protein